jgi:hypothetical protein
VSVSFASPTRGSALSSYRLLWGLWIAFSLIQGALYFQIAVSAARIPQGLLFAFALLLQAIGIPLYVSRREFTSQAQAVIRSAAAAAAFDGLAASILILTGNRFGTIASSPDSLDPLRPGYIATILLLSGLAGASALGTLRWRILQMQQVQPAVQPLKSWWRQYLWSGVLWTAAVTVYYWVISAARWAAGDFDARSGLPYVVPLAAAGLLLIAPIPILSSAREGEGPQKRIWRYLKYSLAVLFVALGLASPFVMGIWFIYFPVAFLTYAVVFLPPLSSWVVLYVRYVQTPMQTTAPPAQRVSAYQPLRLARPNSRIVWWGAAGQVGALLAGLSSMVPASLGLHGIGCRSVSPTDATQYWFWKAYKGFASEVNSGSRMILRPAVNPKACMFVDERSKAFISEPRVISDGYVAAARAWAWLIEPEQWDSERTRQIRKELTRLLGRDFSSYQELEAWWNQNNQNLVWSGTGELLEVRKRDSQVPENHDVYQLRQLDVGLVVGQSRLSEPWTFGPKPVGGFSSYPYVNPFPFDNEARFRAMKLDVADLIVIVSGEQQRRIDEYLHSRFKQDFSTREEWQKFFAQIPRPYPWRVTRVEAQEWIGTLRVFGDKPAFRIQSVGNLQFQTGLTYSNLADFMVWLQNPENTLGEEWVKGEKTLAAYDGPGPFSSKRLALDWLKLLTDQTLDSPEQWVQWWEKNHSNLVLSADGRKLVSKGK